MTDRPPLDIDTALAMVRDGSARRLDGRGDHDSYCIHLGDEQFSVKVARGRPARPNRIETLRRVDDVLKDVDWYPPIVDIGSDGGGVLVVVRPFVEGSPFGFSLDDVTRVCGVLTDLSRLGKAAVVEPDDIVDYATPWIADGDAQSNAVRDSLDGAYAEVETALTRRAEALVDSAVALTDIDSPFVYHGDLHGRNLLFARGQLTGVIDWDDAGFSCRPADAGKALWLTSRAARGEFTLAPLAVRHFLSLACADLGIAPDRVFDLARLGAVWFLPRRRHLDLLHRRDPLIREWYLEWIRRFWARFDDNMAVLRTEVAVLERA